MDIEDINFNSCMVRLKGHHRHHSWASIPDFNSCMVRLKEFRVEVCLDVTEFQFLYGSIKSLILKDYDLQNSHFNSCMVRLKVIIFSISNSIVLISIPVWFD